MVRRDSVAAQVQRHFIETDPMTFTRREFLVTSAAVAAGGIVGRPLVASAWQGQGPPPTPSFTPIRRNVGYFTMRGGTIGYLVNPGAVVVVDSQFPAEATACLTGLKERSSGRGVDFLINTHHHGDHTGGNLKMITDAHATILTHKNARAAMVRANMPGVPPITYTQDAAVSLGGADVELHYVGRGHTEGDTIVYFPDLKAMATGDLFVVLDRVPVIDYANGGSSLEWPKTIDNIMKYDFDTVIPGHGPVAKRDDLVTFRQHLVTLQTRTRDLIKQGVPKDQYLSKLKTDDLGWGLGKETLFVRNSSSGFYDELAKAR
jgi:glyoxylase-like metal-dependent hydrolase (beta-lactamase superfamily II)